jgi:hypothetical protein
MCSTVKPSTAPSGFRLTKWYFDCVSEAGDVAIAYCAQVSWRGVNLHYSSVLASIDGHLATRASLRHFRPPAAENDSIEVNLPAVRIQGNWQRLDPPVRRILLETAAGSVDWHCVQPRSRVALQVDGAALKGIGYAECLTLTLPPWKLPLRELRWGRFASERHSLVWIDWRGEHEARLVLHNGDECALSEISDHAVSLGAQNRLDLDGRMVLRQGELGRTALTGMPALTKIFPRWMLGISETKWRSRATLHSGTDEDAGWAIHEHVEWHE